MSATIGFKLVRRTDLPADTDIKGYKVQLIQLDVDPPKVVAEATVTEQDMVTIDGVQMIGKVLDWQKGPGRWTSRSVALDAQGNEVPGTADFSGEEFISPPIVFNVMAPAETKQDLQ